MIQITQQHAPAIERVAKAANNRAQIQAYENVLINASTDGTVKLTAGDGTVEITSIISAEVKTGGVTTVNAAKLLQALKAAKYDAKIIFKDGAVEVKGSESKFKLATIDSEYYPSFPTDAELIDCDVSALHLIESVKSLAFIAPDNDVRYQLNGVYIGEDCAVTDGHRLSWASLGLSQSAIIPKASIAKIPSVDGKLSLSQSQICITGDDVIIRSKLVDGKYPDYKRVKGDPSKHITVNAASLSAAIKAAYTTINAVTNAVTLNFGETSFVESKSEKQETSRVEFTSDSSDQFAASFNAKYLLDALSFYDGDLVLGFENEQKLIIESGGMTHVIMGLRL